MNKDYDFKLIIFFYILFETPFAYYSNHTNPSK